MAVIAAILGDSDDRKSKQRRRKRKLKKSAIVLKLMGECLKGFRLVSGLGFLLVSEDGVGLSAASHCGTTNKAESGVAKEAGRKRLLQGRVVRILFFDWTRWVPNCTKHSGPSVSTLTGCMLSSGNSNTELELIDMHGLLSEWSCRIGF
ncbi:hypothetical protein Acr_15g0001570 [Actinidia rufa]|uniref:Uncharacterized protein n=1 Tax=Actinidia rufa TaxID=165716 RepID=A0A7J0FUF5_9ERIC|nr:hypothetical protein Acr_15g0001570 [Actinidia rufa]